MYGLLDSRSAMLQEGLKLNTMSRVNDLINARGLSLYGLAKICGLPYSTLKNTAQRNGQLNIDTIERICIGLKISMSDFFAEVKIEE